MSYTDTLMTVVLFILLKKADALESAWAMGVENLMLLLMLQGSLLLGIFGDWNPQQPPAVSGQKDLFFVCGSCQTDRLVYYHIQKVWQMPWKPRRYLLMVNALSQFLPSHSPYLYIWMKRSCVFEDFQTLYLLHSCLLRDSLLQPYV